MISEWITFALIGLLAYSLVDLLEKIVISNKIKSTLLTAIFLAMFYPLHLIIIPFIANVEINFHSLLAFVLGVGLSFAYMLFMYSLLHEELSRVSILGHIHPIFVALLAYYLFNENLRLLDYLAIGIITISASLASYKGGKIVSKALLPMFILNAVIALEYIFTKYILGFISYWSYTFWLMFGLTLVRIVLFIKKSIRRRFLELRLDKRLTMYGFSISLLLLLAVLSSSYALSLHNVSTISAIFAIEPLIILFLVYILKKTNIKIIEEDLLTKRVVLKMISTILVVIGVYLLNI